MFGLVWFGWVAFCLFGSCGIWCLENGFVSCCRFGHKIPFSFSFRIRFLWFFFWSFIWLLYLSLYSERSSCSYLVGGKGRSIANWIRYNFFSFAIFTTQSYHRLVFYVSFFLFFFRSAKNVCFGFVWAFS